MKFNQGKNAGQKNHAKALGDEVCKGFNVYY